MTQDRARLNSQGSRYRPVRAAALLVVLLAACSSEPAAPGGGTTTPAEDTATPVGDGNTVAEDTAVNGDTPGAAAETSPPDPDVPVVVPDINVEPDLIAPVGCEGALKGAYCPCANGDDCESGYCLTSDKGPVCAEHCVSDCPDGWTCADVEQPGGGGDGEFVCVQRTVYFCRPCKDDGDCATPGFEGKDQCVDYGDSGRFCGVACDETTSCPDGTTCAAGQCVLSDGECECATLHTALSAETTCAVSNEYGSCSGARRCEAAGLTACDAKTPAAESCNGLDDDCNGTPDDGVTGSCPITNQFGTCQGTVLCIGGTPKCDGTPPQAELCNGGDDDCDGSIDAGFTDKDLDKIADCVDGDTDGDGWSNEEDNCPLVSNADQLDLDGDKQGDLCDADDDGDSSPDELDCEPRQKLVYPFATEVCDGIDNDCDLKTDEKACDDANSCTDDVCDPSSGCIYTYNAAVCNDANPCTTSDACSGGLCAGAFLNCNDQNPCTTDACSPTQGCQAVPNTLACSDNNACTADDTCSGGVCLPGKQAPCSDGNPCTADSCAAATGCTSTNIGGVCDDGNACTSGDVCVAGTCEGSFADCDDENPCTVDSCDVETGCGNKAVPNGGVCSDGNACTDEDTCQDGECVGGSGGCDCEVDADCKDFEDGDLCNGTLFCELSGGKKTCAVKPGTLISCAVTPGLSTSCASTLCEPSTGTCSTVIGPNGVVCSDANACTQADSCSAGKCSGIATVCQDGEPCTNDLCDTAIGCIYEKVAGFKLCDDGNACTKNDACEAGICIGKQAVVCNDNNPCTADTCSPVGGCGYAPLVGTSCDDGSACTTDDTCGGGSCAGTALACNNGNACDGVELCNPITGCVPGVALQCNDGISCTVDACSPSEGCTHAPNNAPCTDGKWCNGFEQCSLTAGCVPGTPPLLADSVDCTIDTCDEATDKALHIPDASKCSDGNECTTNTCDPTAGCKLANASNGLPCVDGSACTANAVCTAGVCGGGEPCEANGQICSAGICVGGGTASVRFVSVSKVVESSLISARLVVTPTVGGPANGTSTKARFGAILEALELW